MLPLAVCVDVGLFKLQSLNTNGQSLELLLIVLLRCMKLEKGFTTMRRYLGLME